MGKNWNFDSEFVDKKSLVGDEFALSRNLEKVSMTELREVKSKVNFLLEHFKIINKKQTTETTDIKISLLRKFNRFIEGELKTRTCKVNI